MAHNTEVAGAFHSDLRATEHDKKRERDSEAKWRFQSTIKGSICRDTCFKPDGIERILARNEAAGIKTHWKPHKQTDERWMRPGVTNLVKPSGRAYKCGHFGPVARIRNHVNVQEELHNDTAASLIDLLPAQRTGHGTVFDGVANTPIYGDGTSEDPADPPPQRLTLDVFVVESARCTEKLVEKEYEVLDANGEKVRGRKVRQALRNAKNKGDGRAGKDETPAVEDDGFELV